MPDPNAPILTGLLLYGLLGAVGQLVRAIPALGGSQALVKGSANPFSAGYFFVTLMIGFGAGLLAVLIAFDTITQALTLKAALAAMAAGYAGADFIESTYGALAASFGVGKNAGQGLGAQPGAQLAQPSVQPAVQFVAPAIVPTESATGQRLSDMENRVSSLEATVAPAPLSVLASPSNSAAEVTVDMVCKMFPATPEGRLSAICPSFSTGCSGADSPTRKWFVSH